MPVVRTAGTESDFLCFWSLSSFKDLLQAAAAVHSAFSAPTFLYYFKQIIFNNEFILLLLDKRTFILNNFKVKIKDSLAYKGASFIKL
jgi:hypothetical protein